MDKMASNVNENPWILQANPPGKRHKPLNYKQKRPDKNLGVSTALAAV
jgi:hypothetical protein